MSLRRIFCLLAAIAVAVSASAEARAEDRVIRASLNTELQVLDPIVATINATRVFAYLVFDTLIAIDNEGQYHPQMLDNWQVSDDRMTYTFRLRDGLLWSDGTPVTAEDCVESIKRWAKREAFGRQMIEAAQDLHAIDDKTFVLQLKGPFGYVIEALGKPGNTIPVMMPARLAKLTRIACPRRIDRVIHRPHTPPLSCSAAGSSGAKARRAAMKRDPGPSRRSQNLRWIAPADGRRRR